MRYITYVYTVGVCMQKYSLTHYRNIHTKTLSNVASAHFEHALTIINYWLQTLEI